MKEKTLTEEILKERYEYLTNKINELEAERREYDEQIREIQKKDKEKEHLNFTGRCFAFDKDSPIRENKNLNISDIQAFKILNIRPYPKENYAKCLVLREKEDDSRLEESKLSISIENLGLWLPIYMMDFKRNKLIDKAFEIKPYEFNFLLQACIAKLNLKEYRDGDK